MAYQREPKPSSWNPSTQQKSSQFASRPFAPQVQPKSKTPLTPTEIEDKAFEQHRFEAFGLQLKEKSGAITPEETQRLGILQAKMDDFWVQKRARTEGQPNLLEILSKDATNSPKTEPAPLIQRKLMGDGLGNTHEQEPDRVTPDVVQPSHVPESTTSVGGQLQRQEMGSEEKVKLKSEKGTLQRMDDEEDAGIAARVKKRANYNKMTERQKKLFGGIDGNVERLGRHKASEDKAKATRAIIAERVRRGLWDGKTRPSFTENTWNIMLGSVNSQNRLTDGVTVYECEDGSYCPLKRDRIGKEPYVTLDHKINWKQYIYDNAQPEDDGNISKKSASDAYNAPANLVVMSNVKNSEKNGPKGVFD